MESRRFLNAAIKVHQHKSKDRT